MGRRGIFELDLPPASWLQTQLGSDYTATQGGWSYAIHDTDQAFRHAIGLILVFKSMVLPTDGKIPPTCYTQYLPWLLDTLLAYSGVRCVAATTIASVSTPVLKVVLDILKAHKDIYDDFGHFIPTKTYMLLVALCSQFLDSVHLVIAENEAGITLRQTLCVAMIYLSHEALQSRNISTLVTSRLLPPLQHTVLDNPLIGYETDFWVRGPNA